MFATGEAQTAAAELDRRWKTEVLPLVATYCHDCHGDGMKKGELAIDRYDSIAEMQEHREVWKRIRDHLRHRLMPPPDEDQPDDCRAREAARLDRRRGVPRRSRSPRPRPGHPAPAQPGRIPEHPARPARGGRAR